MIINKLKFFIGMLVLLSFIFSFIFSIIFGVLYGLYSEQEIIKVDCYDEYNNKIIGLKCEEVTLKSVFNVPLSISILLLGLSWFITYILNDERKDDSNFFGIGEKESITTQ